jgi:hypothetical protein
LEKEESLACFSFDCVSFMAKSSRVLAVSKGLMAKKDNTAGGNGLMPSWIVWTLISEYMVNVPSHPKIVMSPGAGPVRRCNVPVKAASFSTLSLVM